MIGRLSELLHEVRRQRALVACLTRRALIARYRGTALGLLWSLLHPLVQCGVYALVFGWFLRLEQGGAAYAAFLCAGLVPWLWFSQTLSIATTSILGEAPFLRQAAFSPALPPLVAALAGLVHLLLALPVLLLILFLLGAPPTPWLLLLPLPIALQGLFGLGLSLGLSALCVRYRDTAQVLQAALPVWFLLTPVIYPVERLPAAFAWLRCVNPLAPLSEAFQAALLGRAPAWPAGLLISAGAAALALLLGATLLELLRERIPEEL